MKQLFCILLVCTLASFNTPSEKTTFQTYSIYFINYSGAGSDITVTLGNNQWVTPYTDPGNGGFFTLGQAEEGGYGLTLHQNSPDGLPRYVQIEDPNYQYPVPNRPWYYWSSGDFYGSLQVNDIVNTISVGYL